MTRRPKAVANTVKITDDANLGPLTVTIPALSDARTFDALVNGEG